MSGAVESALSTSGLMLVLAPKFLLRSGSELVIRALFCISLFIDLEPLQQSSREAVWLRRSKSIRLFL